MTDAYVKQRKEHTSLWSSIKSTELTRDNLRGDKTGLVNQIEDLKSRLATITAQLTTLQYRIRDVLAAVADAFSRVIMDTID